MRRNYAVPTVQLCTVLGGLGLAALYRHLEVIEVTLEFALLSLAVTLKFSYAVILFLYFCFKLMQDNIPLFQNAPQLMLYRFDFSAVPRHALLPLIYLLLRLLEFTVLGFQLLFVFTVEIIIFAFLIELGRLQFLLQQFDNFDVVN